MKPSNGNHGPRFVAANDEVGMRLAAAHLAGEEAKVKAMTISTEKEPEQPPAKPIRLFVVEIAQEGEYLKAVVWDPTGTKTADLIVMAINNAPPPHKAYTTEEMPESGKVRRGIIMTFFRAIGDAMHARVKQIMGEKEDE